MTALDFILLAIGLIALVTGAMRGLIRQLGTFIGLICGVLACRIFGVSVVNELVSPHSDHHALLTAACYAALFLLVFIGITLIAGLIHKVISALMLGGIDRFAGGIFRLGLWTVILSLLLNVYLGIYPDDTSRFEVKGKPWRTVVLKAAPKLLGFIAN